MKESKCLRPGCGRDVLNRGLCPACYQAASRLVRLGRTTWDELEKNGRSLPTGRIYHGHVTDWIMGGKQ